MPRRHAPPAEPFPSPMKPECFPQSPLAPAHLSPRSRTGISVPLAQLRGALSGSAGAPSSRARPHRSTRTRSIESQHGPWYGCWTAPACRENKIARQGWTFWTSYLALAVPCVGVGCWRQIFNALSNLEPSRHFVRSLEKIVARRAPAEQDDENPCLQRRHMLWIERNVRLLDNLATRNVAFLQQWHERHNHGQRTNARHELPQLHGLPPFQHLVPPCGWQSHLNCQGRGLRPGTCGGIWHSMVGCVWV